MNKIDFLRDLSKWQACSKDELAIRKPEDLFEAGFVELYEQLHHDLYQRMIRLHGSLFTLEQLRDFPFEYFQGYLYAPGRMEFWWLVIENFYDAIIVIMYGIVNDNSGKDTHTLHKFQNTITQWLREDSRDLFKQTWRGRRFDQAAESIKNRVDEIRINWTAHRLIDKGTGNPTTALAAVSLEELRQLYDYIHALFGALSFGSTYSTLAGDLIPGTIGGRPIRTCLDSVLDAILRDNEFVNRPEGEAQIWPEMRKYLPTETLRAMNKLRERIGLPEA